MRVDAWAQSARPDNNHTEGETSAREREKEREEHDNAAIRHGVR